MTADAVAERTATAVRPHDLLRADQDVEFDDLVALAKVFKRPWSYLLIDTPEVYPSTGSDNRTHANRMVALSPELIAELQMVDLMLDAAADLFPRGGYRSPQVTGDILAADLASRIRSFLGVSVDDQLAAIDDFGALRLWVAALNNQNVYVSQRSLKDPTVRAFSKVRGEQAVVVVSTKDEPHPRIFSVIHEYCHVTLRSAGICDLLDHSEVERFCNEVTAGVLMPRDLLDRLLVPGQFSGSEKASDDALRTLSGRAHVSQQALLIALRDRQVIPQDTYDAMESRRAARRSGGRTSKGHPPYYTVAINKAGRMFAHRIVDSLSEGTIDRQDAGALLGIGEHNVGTLIRALASGD
ncbi:ImmA/IrrE family metallo-endopeptidase [Propionicimonas sp.]|uniref:ImmA/IrrE family metallo-endopeptidase n=1 Tax=Propionicimonas sp. TaxID=1955623 RepID=UPI001D9F1598|nr:ImmA/IrrE family metallo-endopeptidase [Propionicimonas sp.]MBU3977812.1 ImmA/IrrE family metallo-endopeptidase [Actinomycetota bacterium]MBU3987286.1 ImmA/IrrE family metallo-endopeptidase [Actinomycetota bacterium]MBU4009107.1 ImmA/IrrE family metallo-endopeptidase [Actinomycetota bacterium]MBU4065743.1 ImmA/IrrE family metallo-endopeptidase [Actinomycetota bacterium]MBU4093191.1 ImmA/IrrE family metallo-endopeptidase [Actinomycetota bacterium]